MKPLSPQLKALLAQPHREDIIFHLGGEGKTQFYLTNAAIDIAHNGQNYLANGLFIDGKPLPEKADLSSGETPFTFNDLDRAFYSILHTEGYLARPVYAEYAYSNLQNEFVGTLPFFAGTVEGLERVELTDLNRPALTIKCKWLWAVGDTPAGRNCSSGSQKAFFPNDLGLDFVTSLGQENPWGRE